MYFDDQKMVNFDEYCPKCEHYDKSESEDPCFKCLDNPLRSWSRKPINFEEKEKKK